MIGQTASWPNPISSEHIGRTLGPEVSRQVPPVGVALEQLEKELHYIRESVSVLEGRLSIVSRPIPVTNGKDQGGCAGGSPLVNQIDSFCQLARMISAEVNVLIDCLEI